jgi:hypothetical protein
MRITQRVTKGPRVKSKLVPYRKSPTLRVSRNKPCPCKSGKKFKHCCLPKVQVLETLSPGLRQQALVEQILGKPL